MGTSSRNNRQGKHAQRSAASRIASMIAIAAAASIVASCASAPPKPAPKKRTSEYFPESKYGVKASPRVVEYGQPVPQGGGRYMVGKPYKVKGRTYRPFEKQKGYTAVGYASWYGSAFHGRYTANGEVYDMDTLSAAHPTMPLPSYARVTNVGNGASVVVRVNDRGPYERDRIIDLSSKTAELLAVKRHGSVKVKVEYIGPARMEGHDKQMLLATYVAPDNTEIGNPRVMVAMNQVKKASATAVAMRSAPSKPAAPTVMVAARQPQPAPTIAVAMRAPAASPQIVLAMAPIPRARPDLIIAAGTPIDPYNYEVMAAQNDVPLAAPVARQPAAVASVEPAAVAAPTVIRASAAGDGSDYGPRTLGSFTVSDPTAFSQPEYGFDDPAASNARSYAAGPERTGAQRAAEAMATGSHVGLKRELEEAVARLAAERRAEATEIAVGIFASDANALAMAEKVAWLGRATSGEVEIGGRRMHEVRVLVTKRGVSDGEAVRAVEAAGARGAYIVTR